MSRISRDEMLMLCAEAASLRSTCMRPVGTGDGGKPVVGIGAVVAIQNRPISLGYSGVPSGQPHCGAHCDLSQPCTKTIHAEHNAIVFARDIVHDLREATLYTTVSPCIECAHTIWLYKIPRVVYRRPYRNLDGVAWLKLNGVIVERV